MTKFNHRRAKRYAPQKRDTKQLKPPRDLDCYICHERPSTPGSELCSPCEVELLS